MSILSSVMSSVMSPVISAVAVITRYFTTIASAGSQHYTIPPVTFTGDFEVHILASLTDATGYPRLLSDTIDDFALLFVSQSNDRLTCRIGAIYLTSPTAIITDGKLNAITLKRDSGVLYLGVNGAFEAGTVNADPVTFDMVGRDGDGGSNFNGIIANVQMYDNGTLVRDYKLDENWQLNNIAVDSANSDGAELVTQAGWVDTSTGSGSYSQSGDTFTVSGVDYPNRGEARFTFDTVVGKTYIVTSDVEADNGAYLTVGGEGTGTIITHTVTATGINTFYFVAETLSSIINLRSQGGVSIFELPSIRETTNGQAINITSADSELYTQVDDGWLGEELVTNGDFSDGATGWALGVGWSVVDGKAVAASAEWSGISQVSSDLGARTYLFSFDIVSISSGGFRFNSGGGGYITPTRTVAGHYEEVVTPTAGGVVSFGSVGVDTTGSVDNISIREIIEVAS